MSGTTIAISELEVPCLSLVELVLSPPLGSRVRSDFSRMLKQGCHYLAAGWATREWGGHPICIGKTAYFCEFTARHPWAAGFRRSDAVGEDGVAAQGGGLLLLGSARRSRALRHDGLDQCHNFMGFRSAFQHEVIGLAILGGFMVLRQVVVRQDDDNNVGEA